MDARQALLRTEKERIEARNKLLAAIVADQETNSKQIGKRLAKADISNERIVDALQASLYDDNVFIRRVAEQILEGLGDEGSAILEEARAKRQREDDLRSTRS